MKSTITIEVSPGELIDKLTILEIRLERIEDAGKRGNIAIEHDLVAAAHRDHIAALPEVAALKAKLHAVNAQLWEIEDKIRDCERRSDFGDAFVALARSVYVTNDLRSALKREINTILGSRLVEEKSYKAY